MWLLWTGRTPYKSRSTWACELKFEEYHTYSSQCLSRSTWACELKFCLYSIFYVAYCHAPRERVSWNIQALLHYTKALSHAPRERVSWNLSLFLNLKVEKRHAPRERVSWNKLGLGICPEFKVTLHVSVWVEIEYYNPEMFPDISHAPRERVSWN